MIMLTDAERVRLSQAVETDQGTGRIAAVVYAVESTLASHMAGAQAEAWSAGVEYMAERCVDEHGISADYRLGANPFTADTENTE